MFSFFEKIYNIILMLLIIDIYNIFKLSERKFARQLIPYKCVHVTVRQNNDGT